MKKFITTFLISCIALIMVGCSTTTSALDTSINLIEDDIGGDITIKAVYYNEDQKGCVVAFEYQGMDDIACVHLDTKDIGYESISKKLSGSSLVSYSYDSIWVFNAKMNGSSKGWNKIN